MSYSSLYPHHLAQFLAHPKGSIHRVSEGMKTVTPAHSLCTHHIPSPTCHASGTVVQTRGNFAPRDISSCLDKFATIGGGRSVPLASSRMLLSILQYPGQPPTTKNYPSKMLIRAKNQNSGSKTGSGT